MPKFLIRIVSFLLVPCLFVDPAFASGYYSPSSPRHAYLTNETQAAFLQEALTAHLVESFHNPFDRLAAHLSRMGHDLNPATAQVPKKVLSPIANHVGFGIRMSGAAAAFKKSIDNRKEMIMSAVALGEVPAEFRRETIRMNGSSWQVIVHQDVLKRVESQGITFDEFIQNTIKIRGPKYSQALMERLNGKRLVIDALEATPNLYGNCQGEGYTYINLHAPAAMDIVGISHEWMHESGLFSGSKKDEARLAIQDRTIMAEMGMTSEHLQEALREVVTDNALLLRSGPIDRELFIGDWSEMKPVLQPFLVQIGWAPDKIERFLDGVRELLTVHGTTERQLPGLKSQLWQVLLDVGSRKDLRDFEDVDRLSNRLDRLKHNYDLNARDFIINLDERMAYEVFANLDHRHRFSSLLALLCPELDSRPQPALLEGVLPTHIARTMLSNSPSGFVELALEKHDFEQSMESPRTILKALPDDLRLEAAKRILLSINNNERIQIEQTGWSWMEFYYAVINSFQDRVGLLSNPMVFRRIYEGLFSDLLGLEGVGEDTMEGHVDVNVSDLANYLGHEPDEMEIEQDIASAQNLALGAFEMRATEFFNYNPGPEMLEQAIDFFRNDTGRHPIRLSPSEANTLIWLVRHIPKRDGFTRDRRRQVHRYLLAMWEDRYRDPQAATRKFMGGMISSIDIPSMSPQGVTACLNFMLQFTNLAHPLRQSAAQALAQRMEQWRQTASNKKAFLGPDQFKEMTEMINQILIEHLTSRAVTFTPEEIQRLRTHVIRHPAAWEQHDFLQLLASYHSFQNEAGKRHTEDFIRELLASKIEGDRFTAMPRYDWSSKIKRWMGAPLRRQWGGGYRTEVALKRAGPLGPVQFQGIYRDIMEHFGIQPPSQPEELGQRIRDWVMAPENQDIPQSERDTLAAILGDILSALAVGAPISSEQVRDWREQLLPPGTIPHWYQSREAWREIFINLDQILRIQTFDWSQVTGLSFEVTDDPVDFALSGTDPYQTCQRLNEPTGQNTDGRPINRLRQGQFLLARLVARKKDGSSVVLARAHLELGEGIRSEDYGALMSSSKENKNLNEILLDAIFGPPKRKTSHKKLDIQPRKVLLVERLYQQGVLPAGLFYEEVLRWALKGSRHNPLFDYAIFAGHGGSHEAPLYLRFLPSDGPIYRDTFAEGVWNAMDLHVLAHGDASVNAAAQELDQNGAVTVTHHFSPSGSWFQTKSGWYERLVAWWFEPLVSLGIPVLSAAVARGYGMGNVVAVSLTVGAASAAIFRYPHLWLRGQETFKSAPVRELTWVTAVAGLLLGSALTLPFSLGLLTTITHAVTVVAIGTLTLHHAAINNSAIAQLATAA